MKMFDEDEIVISGIGGRFPESENLEELKDNLFSGKDMVTSENPRWIPGVLGVPIRTGKMKSLDKFDAQYFGIMRKQCHALDPVTRQVLERCYEAVLDAGLNPLDLKGSNTCVFFGSTISETEVILVHSKQTDGYGIMGRNRGLNSNRLSYWLDLKGNSCAFDAMWESGLHGFQLAYQYMKYGICDSAIVACGNNIVHANASKQYQDLNFLSPDGVTKSFDNDADGYARSEAVSVFIVQKAKDAKRSYGTVVHVLSKSMNTADGQIIAPRKEDWIKLYEEFYEQCKIDPNDVTFLEADAPGYQGADIAEMNAVEEFFCRERDSKNPLLVGSVKSNLGHAEAAAAGCSIAKVLVATHTGKIPPNLHYRSPNTKIAGLVNGKMKVVTEATPLEGELLAINSFGIGGTYGHMLIRRKSQPKPPSSEVADIPRIVLVSGRNEEGVHSVLDRIESAPVDNEYIGLVHNVFRQNLARQLHRGYTVIPVQENKIRGTEVISGVKRQVWFVFAGMGSQWATMGKDLMALPIFRESIEACHKALAPKGIDLKHIITHDDKSIFDNILNSFVGIAAVQIGLLDILKALKIEPDGMIGHSVGEMGAGYADNGLTREQMILAAYSRGKASLETPVIKGMMAAIGKGYNEMKDIVPKEIEIACHNASNSCTISGPADDVNEFVEKLKKDGVFARAVNVSNIAYHSKHIAKIGPTLYQYLKNVIPEPKKRSSRWLSTSFPEERWGEPQAQHCSAEYFTNNLLSPVYFEEASRHIPPDAIIIEVAPHGLLQAILKRSLGSKCSLITLTNRNNPNQLHCLYKAIGTMYLVGLEPQVSALYPKISFPVSIGTPSLASLAVWDHSDTWKTVSHAVSSHLFSSKDIEIPLLKKENSIYRSYKFEGKTFLPYAKYLMLVWEVYLSGLGRKIDDAAITFENILFKKYVEVSKQQTLSFSVMVMSGTGEFEVLENDEVMMTGCIKDQEPAKSKQEEKLIKKTQDEVVIEGNDFYTELLQSGHDYSEPFRKIKKLKIGEKGTVWKTEIEWNESFFLYLESLVQILLLKAAESDGLRQLSKIQKLEIDPSKFLKKTSNVDVTFELVKDVLSGTGIYGFGFQFRPVSRTPLKCSDSELNLLPPAIPTSGNFTKISYIEMFGKNIQPLSFGYSGKNLLGRGLMGLASADELSLTIRPDEILTYSIPQKWSLEEAASVPVSYSLGYYAINIIGNLKESESVLVLDGSTSLGRACVSVALESTKLVYVMVSTKEGKESLLKSFNKLKEENIIISDSDDLSQFTVDFQMLTKSEGADLIVSTIAGDSIKDLLYCMSTHGKTIAFFKEKCKEGQLLQGTENFARNCSFYSIALDAILNLAEEDKMKLKNLMSQGLTSGTVLPLPKKIVTAYNGKRNEYFAEILKLDTTENHPKLNRYICEPGKSCVIIGGQTHSWLQIAEWFVKRQTKQITIINSNHEISNHASYKLQQLKESAKISINTIKSYDPHTIRSILQEAGNISVAILLPVEKFGNNTDVSYELLKSFDLACQDRKCYAICVLKSSSKGVKICTARNENGLPTVAVLWDSHINGKTQGFIQMLDSLLCQNQKSVIQIKDENDDKKALVKDKDVINNSLPKCPDELAEFGQNITDVVRITEIKTLSPALKYVKETLPFFLIPGIGKKEELVKRFQKSYYPVFVVDVPHLGKSSIEEYAAYIIPKMKSITPGPYLLIGDNWGGSVAFELGRQLESLGERVHVFLLSGTPYEILEPVKSIGEDLETLQMGLLKRAFQIDDVKVLQEISNQENWNKKLNFCSSFVKDEVRNHVFKGLDAIKHRLESLMSYSLIHALKGPLTIITKVDIPISHINQLCKEQVEILSVDVKEDILNDDVFRMIHDSSICKKVER